MIENIIHIFKKLIIHHLLDYFLHLYTLIDYIVISSLNILVKF